MVRHRKNKKGGTTEAAQAEIAEINEGTGISGIKSKLLGVAGNVKSGLVEKTAKAEENLKGLNEGAKSKFQEGFNLVNLQKTNFFNKLKNVKAAVTEGPTQAGGRRRSKRRSRKSKRSTKRRSSTKRNGSKKRTKKYKRRS